MSTPSVTILKNLVLNWESNQMEEETIATFYRHYDGYPSCHAIDIANSLVVASRDAALHHGRDLLGAVRMSAGSKPLRPWQVCAGDVIGSGKRVEYVFERYGELYINASDEELVRQGKRTYGEELTRLYDLDLSGWRVIGHYGCGRGYEGRSWYDMGKPFGRR